MVARNAAFFFLAAAIALLFLSRLVFFSGISSSPTPLPSPPWNSSPAEFFGSPLPTIIHNVTISNDDAMAALARMAKMLNATNPKGLAQCYSRSYGKGWGAHTLCRAPLNCKFISFGISHDFSMDADLADSHHCVGVGLDPTFNHPERLHNNVWFLSVGATSLYRPQRGWIVSSVVQISKFLHWDWIDVLKMDCEGCEYAIARDVLAEDPYFFDRVGQFSVEIHTSRRWMLSFEYVYALGRLYYLLEQSGLKLTTKNLAGCHPDHEAPGCFAELYDMGYPCICANLLFSRPQNISWLDLTREWLGVRSWFS